MVKKSKDYIIFKIRYYADGINVRKGVFGDKEDEMQRKQHWYRANEYIKFFWSMFEKVTNIDHTYYSKKYFLSSMECAVEELFEKYDILIPDAEEYYYWFIPKKEHVFIEWIHNNCTLPFKIVKRSEYSSCLNNSKTTWKRSRVEKWYTENSL